MLQKEIDYDKIYDSGLYGLYKIIGYNENNKLYKIKFITTGYELEVKMDRLTYKDPYYPRICGVGYLGNQTGTKTYNKKYYDMWYNMISRCYNPNSKDYYRYGGKGVTVDKRWHSFENYLNDIAKLDNFDLVLQYPFDYQLDKDYLQLNIPINERVYSKDTCIWLHKNDNAHVKMIDNRDTMINKYHGVYANRGFYYVTIFYNQEKITLGRFTDIECAANAFNYYYSLLYPNNAYINLPNTVPYIPPEVFSKNNSMMKELCRRVK